MVTPGRRLRTLDRLGSGSAAPPPGLTTAAIVVRRIIANAGQQGAGLPAGQTLKVREWTSRTQKSWW
jgi:hypothetical protein